MTVLTQNASRAVAWSTLEVLMRQGIQFLVLVVLARLLTPSDFGMISMIALFVGLANIFVDSGFSSALVQRRSHTYEDESTVFWFNVGAATAAAALLILAAPWISDFYAKPMLRPLMILMAGNLWLGSLIVVHTALLTKRLEFRTLTRVSFASSAAGGAAAIGLAVYGWGVWALAMQFVTTTIVRIVLLWRMHPWRPAWLFSVDSFHGMFKFGGFMLISGVLDTLATRIYTLLIGKFYSAADLGYYDRATALKDIPQNAIANVFSRVAFPVFSSHSNDVPKLRHCVRSSVIVVMALNLPLMFGLLATADNIVPLLLGSRWSSTIPILKVLCIVGMLYPLQIINLEALKAQGRSDVFFRLELIKKGILLCIIIVCSQLSVLAIAWGFALNSVGGFFINARYTKKFLEYPSSQQLRDVSPYFAASFLMAFIVMGLGHWTGELPLLPRIGMQVIVGGVIYCASAYVLKFEGYFLIRDMFAKAKIDANAG